MRSTLTPAALALVILALAAAPAGFARVALSIGSAQLVPLRLAPAPASARKEIQRSCQVGASRARARAAGQTERRSSTVACEQPPRSNLDLSGALRGAQAAAVAAAG